jgi:hypothetical protein
MASSLREPARVSPGRPVKRMLQGTDSVPADSRQGLAEIPALTSRGSPSARERSSGPALTAGCADLRIERYYGRLRLPPGRCPLPGSTPVTEQRCPRQYAARSGRGGSPQFPPSSSERSVPTYAGESLAAALQDLHRFHGLRREPPGSALSRCLTTRQASLPLRTAQLLPLKGFRRWAPTRPVSRPGRQPATGLPGDYPDRTHTGRRRRASDQVMTAGQPPP